MIAGHDDGAAALVQKPPATAIYIGRTAPSTLRSNSLLFRGDATVRIREAAIPGSISFGASNSPGWFLHHRNFELWVDDAAARPSSHRPVRSSSGLPRAARVAQRDNVAPAAITENAQKLRRVRQIAASKKVLCVAKNDSPKR